MIAKAEVLQASIGVSCNEQDLQDSCLDPAAIPRHEDSNQDAASGRTLLSSIQDNTTSATGQKGPTLEGEPDDQDVAGADSASHGAEARAAVVEGPEEQALPDKLYR